MTKLEIQMQNNELEARVIELEAARKADEKVIDGLRDELDAKEIELVSTEAQLDEADGEAMLHAADKAQQAMLLAALPTERFADWYARLHPCAGSNPDLRVLAEQVRIIA